MWYQLRDLIDNPFKPVFLYLLLIINIFGSIWGYIWYNNQLAATPVKYWLFVPDCPFATTLMSVLLVLFIMGKRNSLLELLTYTALIKYGSWTVFVLTLDGLTGGQFDFQTWMLFFSHVGMIIQGFFFIRFIKVRFRDILIVIPWMLLNDYMDYVVGVYPYLPNQGHLPGVTIFTVTFTLMISLLLIKSGIRFVRF